MVKRDFGAIKRVINTDYRQSGDDYPLQGVVLPSAVTDSEEVSGFKLDVHANEMVECAVTVEVDGEPFVVKMSARAMEILRNTNRNGAKIGYLEAAQLAKEEKEQAKVKAALASASSAAAPVEVAEVGVSSEDGVTSRIVTTDDVEGTLRSLGVPVPPPPPTAAEPSTVTIDQEMFDSLPNPVTEAQMAPKPVVPKGKKRGSKSISQPVATSKKTAVTFKSRMGTMTILVERAFVGGAKDVCLVIIQHSPEGHFYIPPQVDDVIEISFEGKVYKCFTGIYYQIPGTSVMHTIYFVNPE